MRTAPGDDPAVVRAGFAFAISRFHTSRLDPNPSLWIKACEGAPDDFQGLAAPSVREPAESRDPETTTLLGWTLVVSGAASRWRYHRLSTH